MKNPFPQLEKRGLTTDAAVAGGLVLILSASWMVSPILALYLAGVILVGGGILAALR